MGKKNMDIGVQQKNQPQAQAATSPYVRKYYKKKYPNKSDSPTPRKAGAAPRKYYRRRADNVMRIEIPPCSQDYIKALYDPFATESGVCIPCDLFPLPSQKSKATIRGTFNLGTTGFGFILFAPAVTNDSTAVTVTGTASAGNAPTAFDTYSNLGTGVLAKLPYSTADIVTNKVISARVVAAGVRIRYSGKETDRSGLYAAVEDQDHTDLSTESVNSISQDFSNTYTRRPSGDGSWDSTACYSGPTAPHHIDFTNLAYPIQPTQSSSECSPLCIACMGLAGDLIEFEATVHVEYIGKKVESKTVSHADTKSYGAVLETTKSVAAERPIEPSIAKDGFTSFINKVVEYAPKIVGAGVAVVQSLVTRNPTPLLTYAGTQALPALTYPGH